MYVDDTILLVSQKNLNHVSEHLSTETKNCFHWLVNTYLLAYICYTRYTPPLHMHASYYKKAGSLAIRGITCNVLTSLLWLHTLLRGF